MRSCCCVAALPSRCFPVRRGGGGCCRRLVVCGGGGGSGGGVVSTAGAVMVGEICWWWVCWVLLVVLRHRVAFFVPLDLRRASCAHPSPGLAPDPLGVPLEQCSGRWEAYVCG
eukprot:1190162-Prymnesium_polylepis.1